MPYSAHEPARHQLTRLTDVNLHRLIRRGTTYGPPYDPNALSEADDEVPRGAIFLFISAKAMATMEFLQQEWINDGNFIGVGDERDPIIGLQEEGATFTIPKDPVRRRVHGIETFNVLRGGEYFFMPSISGVEMARELKRMNGGPSCPITLTARARLANPRRISPTSSPLRASRTLRARFSPHACSLRPVRVRCSRTRSITHRGSSRHRCRHW